jgi:hypothetical protein
MELIWEQEAAGSNPAIPTVILETGASLQVMRRSATIIHVLHLAGADLRAGGHRFESRDPDDNVKSVPRRGPHADGLPSRTCFSFPRFCATAALIFGIASGATSLSAAGEGSSSTLFTSRVALAASSSL